MWPDNAIQKQTPHSTESAREVASWLMTHIYLVDGVHTCTRCAQTQAGLRGHPMPTGVVQGRLQQLNQHREKHNINNNIQKNNIMYSSFECTLCFGMVTLDMIAFISFMLRRQEGSITWIHNNYHPKADCTLNLSIQGITTVKMQYNIHCRNK